MIERLAKNPIKTQGILLVMWVESGAHGIVLRE